MARGHTAGRLEEIGLGIEHSVVGEGALGDDIWKCKGDVRAPDDNEMCWSNTGCDELTVEQYREMDSVARMELLKQAQGVMYRAVEE